MVAWYSARLSEEYLKRGSKPKRLARSVVEAIHRTLDIFHRYMGQRHRLGEELPQQPVAVLV